MLQRVIASAAKQSSISPRKDSGLLRCTRNDGVCRDVAHLQPTSQLADTLSRSRGLFRPSFAPTCRPFRKKGRREGRAPAGTRDPCAGKCTRGGSQVCRSPGLPCADGFNGVLRALPGERCTIAPVASPIADAREPGRATTSRQGLTHRPRASGPHDFSVRGRPHRAFQGWRVLTQDADEAAVTAPCRIADRNVSRDCPPCHHVARRRCRVHRIPARIS